MCLHTNWKNPRITKRDIIVWKKFHNTYEHKFTSVCWRMMWKINKLYKVNMAKLRRGMADFIITEGFHSFVSTKEASMDGLNHDVIVKCIIPKGSLYYKGRRTITQEYGTQIVSNQLRILPINK